MLNCSQNVLKCNKIVHPAQRTFILNFMANPMIFRCHYKLPYISLYLESPTPPPKPGSPVVSGAFGGDLAVDV